MGNVYPKNTGNFVGVIFLKNSVHYGLRTVYLWRAGGGTVYALVLGTSEATRVGSNPTPPTIST